MEKRRTEKRLVPWKIILVALGAAIILGGLLATWIVISHLKTSNTIAKVVQDGREIYSVDLSQITEPYTYEVIGAHGERNLLLIEPGQISMKEANCPDQLCVRTEAIHSGWLPIICLPNRVTVHIQGGMD